MEITLRDGTPVRLADEKAKAHSLVVVYTLDTNERKEVSPRQLIGL